MKRFLYLPILTVVLAACGTGATYIDEAPDNAAPSIEDGAIDVAVTGTITVTFSKTVDTSSVTTSTLFLAPQTAGSDIVPLGTKVLKEAFNAALCDPLLAVAATVTCASGTECSVTPNDLLEHSTKYAICITNGIYYADGNQFPGKTTTFTTVAAASCVAPTCSAIHAAIIAGNTTGIRPGTNFTSVTLPDFTCARVTPTLATTGLPDYFSFDTSSRVLSGGPVPLTATTGNTITYTETNTSTSVSCLLQDMDGDTILDHIEYSYGELPLLNLTFGWVWLDPSNVELYRPERSGAKSIPTGLVVPTTGLDLNNAADAAEDFDGDGLTNLTETTNGTNIFVAESSGAFAAATNYPAGDAAYGLALGDFNVDGFLDLAVGNADIDKVSILMGNGDGTFDAAVTYSTGDYPTEVIAGDFNGDGLLDLSVANWTSTNFSVFIGKGDGTFDAAVNYDGVGKLLSNIAVDLNNDGILDMAVVRGDDDKLSIFLGEGDGTFVIGVTYDMGSGPTYVTAGEFNGDGNLDLVVADGPGDNIRVLMGNGDGTFDAAVIYSAGDYVCQVNVADFNNDDVLDLATANCLASNVSVLLGVGDGTFGDAVNYSAGAVPWAITAGDLNGDGNVDLATANTDADNASVLIGNGDGTFDAAVTYSAGNGPCWIISGDFNGDGIIELVVSNYYSDTISIFLGE